MLTCEEFCGIIALSYIKEIIIVTKKYDQRKESNKRYLEKFDQISYRVPEGGKDELKAFVKEVGYPSVNQFLVDAVENYKKVVLEEMESNSGSI